MLQRTFFKIRGTMNILDHSLSLRFAVVERNKKLYAMERQNIMKSDNVLVWTDSMMSARSWKGAIYSDRIENYDRQWTPVSRFPIVQGV